MAASATLAVRETDIQDGPRTRRVLPGEYYVTGDDELIATTLGSCVAVCMRDPEAQVGGMNHFLLPEDGGLNDSGAGLATRYGSYAMESLINDLLKRGARRERLEIKVFGGGHILSCQADVGARNIRFIRHFLQVENLQAVAGDLGDSSPRRVAYSPRTGVARVKRLPPLESNSIARAERTYLSRIDATAQGGEVELFDSPHRPRLRTTMFSRCAAPDSLTMRSDLISSPALSFRRACSVATL
jgi:chemotaxis protein CheD